VPPSAPVDALRVRADLLARTRSFFAARGVLEVDTPLLADGLVVDAHIDPVTCDPGTAGGARYLLPSPEAPMKRLLAAGSGPIYQIAKAFRAGERGRLHQPEFTMLEWYRPGFDDHDLMDEVGALVQELLGVDDWVKRPYADVFAELLGVDAHAADAETLAAAAESAGVQVAVSSRPADRDGWLELLFATCIEPRLDPAVATFVHDFPATQAALAVVDGDPPVARRFELLLGGMELCNGYLELLDAAAHRERFDAANDQREALGKARIARDDALVAAIEQGLPASAGVAVGFDRIVMLACGADHIDQVLPFAR
jgi:lysyl-tRNA synthetase class 2